MEIREEALPAPKAGEALVRGLASCVSQGTEMLLYKGEGPEPFDVSLGDTSVATYPRRYGYAWVGEVEEVGPGVAHPLGTRVFALAPHGDAHVLRASELKALPKAVPATRAVLAANLETAVTCAWDAEPNFGERCVVLGGGVVGTLVAWVLARSGTNVTLVERSATRRAAASALVPSARVITDAAPDGRADLVVEATGDPRVLDTAIAWAGFEARVVVASFYGARRAPVDLGNAFHRKRLTLRATQVSSLPPKLRPRWDMERRLDLVVDLLREERLDSLFGSPTDFDRAPQLYEELARQPDPSPAHTLLYR
ncbi:Threonine dehydrogenase [Labilithrix luteola]|uniref:Threonine dehydrogenase n=1 Tax=Labilithrix luteola TaxID=1391654 RepID=A0A0K1PRC7_9BACT|nr:Threonine dehydrogenase [Labilithrix luteola]